MEVFLAAAALVGFLAASFVAHWLLCRVIAEQCPRCGSRWMTALAGEWDCEEDWQCNNCRLLWSVKFRPR